ncbi:DUF192 domain-containing protein [Geminocystis sp. NIES-3709]|uniref:DUF192 domain-containing protein n=1 Tax=Geminocystis sp. NIES-3709 TaxID=1617448 RepID=UPI0005FCD5F5|nr:DUF192 domain-containing protein [Geminocystis sp. NIES-3709]BAQ63762.1 hypothetical protein GM3709_527 [Geminocystis sp. NIES-3709]
MMRYSSPLIITLSFLFLSCGFQPSSVSGSDENVSPKITPVDNTIQSQNLPIGAKLLINQEVIELEIAQTPQQQAIGLMYRDSLLPNRGMLFPFNPPQTVSFWMKNVSIPLDMIFVSDGVIKHIAKAPPCEIEPCPLYNSTVPIDQVIELAGGRTEELKIKVGDEINIEFLEKMKN